MDLRVFVLQTLYSITSQSDSDRFVWTLYLALCANGSSAQDLGQSQHSNIDLIQI